MAKDVKSPKCDSTEVQLSNESSKHGCFYIVIFGVWYFMFLMYKWTFGIMLLVCYDWWMAIVRKVSGKGHVWKSKKWLSIR